MNKPPIPLPNNGFSKPNHGYTFENSADNRLVSDCISRGLERDGNEADHEANRIKYEAMKMDKIIVEMWLLNLGSGLYRQEKKFLRGQGDYYSAIGVLLDITREITGGKWHGCWFIPKGEWFTKGYNQDNYYMPNFAAGKLNYTGFQNDYVVLNQSKTFDELVIIIKTEYL